MLVEKRIATVRDLVLPPQTLAEGVDAFLVLHAGQKSASYVTWCRQRLSSLLRFFGPDKKLVEVEIWQLELWFADLAGRGEQYAGHPYRAKVQKKLSAATLDGYVRCAKTLWNWLTAGKRFVLNNPAALLQRPDQPDLPPKGASRAEVRALLDHTSKKNYRDYAIIRLFQATGIRLCGFEGLRLADVNVDERWVFVREKGRGGRNKSRYVPFDERTATILKTYLAEHRPQLDCDAFFISLPRNGVGATAVSGGAFYQQLRRYRKALKLPRSISPHMFRHFFGAECAQRGMSASAIQQLMGHEDPKTTAVYVKFNPQQMQGVYDNSFPMTSDIEG